MLYKRIVPLKDSVQLVYYDKESEQLTDVCKPDNKEYVHMADLQNTIFHTISERLRPDSTRSKRSIDFCFAVSKTGISNIRLISYDLNYDKEEVQQLLENVLIDLDLKANTECLLIVEIPFWDYTFYSKTREKKSPGGDRK